MGSGGPAQMAHAARRKHSSGLRLHPRRRAARPQGDCPTQRHLQQRLIVGARINRDGQAGGGDNAAAGSVQRQPRDGHANGLRRADSTVAFSRVRQHRRHGAASLVPTAMPRLRSFRCRHPPCMPLLMPTSHPASSPHLHAQVPQVPHALAVGQADGLDAPLRPVFEDGKHGALVLKGQVHGARQAASGEGSQHRCRGGGPCWRRALAADRPTPLAAWSHPPMPYDAHMHNGCSPHPVPSSPSPTPTPAPAEHEAVALAVLPRHWLHHDGQQLLYVLRRRGRGAGGAAQRGRGTADSARGQRRGMCPGMCTGRSRLTCSHPAACRPTYLASHASRPPPAALHPHLAQHVVEQPLVALLQAHQVRVLLHAVLLAARCSRAGGVGGGGVGRGAARKARAAEPAPRCQPWPQSCLPI